MRFICTSLAVVLSVAVLSARPAHPQSWLRYAVHMPATARAHEPVFVTYAIDNTSPDAIEADLGWNQTGALSFTVTRPDGTATTVRTKSPDLGGFSRSHLARIAAGTTFTASILLNQLMDITTPGTYRIAIASDASFKAAATGTSVAADKAWATTLIIRPSTEADRREICDTFYLQRATAAITEEDLRKARALLCVRHPLAPTSPWP